jgi:hypothetical protein
MAPLTKDWMHAAGGSPFIGQKYFAIQILHKNQIGADLLKDPSQSVSGNCRVEGKFA